ncbi:MAG: hypothetical protein ACREPR_09315 [Brasilonema sp.]
MVPLWAVNAIWSYDRRHNPNVSAQFCFAIEILAALEVFFGQFLVSSMTRGWLEWSYLLQLQVFHSFDTLRRKDLGYSI